jgi:hypothetical protein
MKNMATATTWHSYMSMTEVTLEFVLLVKREWYGHDILHEMHCQKDDTAIPPLSHGEAKGSDYIYVCRGRNRVRSFDQTKLSLTVVAIQRRSVYCISTSSPPMLFDCRSIETGTQIPCGYVSSRLHRPVLLGRVATSLRVYFVTDIVLRHIFHHSLSGYGVRRFADMSAHGSNENVFSVCREANSNQIVHLILVLLTIYQGRDLHCSL